MTVKLFLQCLGTFGLATLIFSYIYFLFDEYITDESKDFMFSLVGACLKIFAIGFMGFLIYAIWFIGWFMKIAIALADLIVCIVIFSHLSDIKQSIIDLKPGPSAKQCERDVNG